MKCPRCDGDLLEDWPDWARDSFRYKCPGCGHLVTMKGALREPIAKVEDCDTVQAESMVIKREPELRHVLSHLMNAIEHLAEGATESALHELESISGLVFWEDTDDMRGYLDGRAPTTQTGEQQEQMHGEEQAADAEETSQVKLDQHTIPYPQVGDCWYFDHGMRAEISHIQHISDAGKSEREFIVHFRRIEDHRAG